MRLQSSKASSYRLQMRLFKRPDTGYWFVEFERGKKRSLKTKDEALARVAFNKLKREFVAGRLIQLDAGGKVTLEKFKDEYLDWAESAIENTHTFKANRLALRKLEHYAGGSTPLNKLGQRVIDLMVADLLKKKRKISTINNYIRHSRTVLEKALEWKYIKSNPLKNVKELSGGKTAPGFLDAAQVKDFIGKVKNIDVRRMVIAYITSGVRRTELLQLVYPRDIDFERELIRVERLKRRETTVHWIPLHPHFKAVLKSMSLEDGKRIFRRWQHPDTITHKVKEALVKAGYGHLKLHSLRHTNGALLAMAGFSERTIADMLGHAQTSTASIYTHSTQEHLKAAVNTAVQIGPVDLTPNSDDSK